jgi:putative tryptophan/tyrosine transport system substrate-binding protein
MQIDLLKRREFITLLGTAATWPLAARAQQSETVRRIGVLMTFAQTDAGWQRTAAEFLKALEHLGWVRGRNLEIEFRWDGPDPDQIQRYATELVELKSDLIVCQATPSVRSLQRTTRTIPIVFVNVSDPLGSGFIESLARPGGNITGFSNFEPAMGGKWVELIKEIAPSVTRIALMSNPDTSPQARFYFPSIENAALSLGLQTIVTPVRDDAEIDHAIVALAHESGGGLVLLSDIFTLANHELIVRLADQYRVPAVYPFCDFAKSGGLLSYGVDVAFQFPQAAAYVDRILKGEKPRELPVQGPTKFELIVNIKTAKALGLSVPNTLLVSADEVIE